MDAYRQLLKENKLLQNFSHKVNCLDNSPMENFFVIKARNVLWTNLLPLRKTGRKTIAFIHCYNQKRMKRKQGCLSPVHYRMNFNFWGYNILQSLLNKR